MKKALLVLAACGLGSVAGSAAAFLQAFEAREWPLVETVVARAWYGDGPHACDPATFQASDGFGGATELCTPVAARDLPAGVTLAPEHVRWIPMPPTFIPQVAVTQPTGRTTALPLLEGELFRDERLTSEGTP